MLNPAPATSTPVSRRSSPVRPRNAEPRPLRKGIPRKLWQGFDSAIAPARPKIRGAFSRSTALLQRAFTMEDAKRSIEEQGNLEQLISSPAAEEAWRPSQEELLDLYLGPRERLQARGQKILGWSKNPAVNPREPFNAERLNPQQAPIVGTMTATSKIAGATTEPLRLDWWDRRTMQAEMIAWSKLHAAARVTAIDEATRGGIREIITGAFDFDQGLDRDGIARALRALDGSNGTLRLGLDRPRQAQLMKFIDELGPLPAGRRQLLIDRRFRQLLKARANTIARTEALTVGNVGQDLTWRKAVADGEINAALYVLEWVTRAIRVCPRCQAMDGHTRELTGGLFVSDLGEAKENPDLHPRGYCITRTIRRQDARSQYVPPTIDIGARTRKLLADAKASGTALGKADVLDSLAKTERGKLTSMLARGSENIFEFEGLVKDVADTFGYVAGPFENPAANTFIVGPVKSLARAAEKIVVKLKGEAGDLTDILRATYVVENPADAQNLFDALRAIDSPTGYRDRMLNPLDGGYRDVIFKLTLQDGMQAEIQVHVAPILKAKNAGGHLLYEEMRTLEKGTPRWTELLRQSEELYGGEWAEVCRQYPEFAAC